MVYQVNTDKRTKTKESTEVNSCTVPLQSSWLQQSLSLNSLKSILKRFNLFSAGWSMTGPVGRSLLFFSTDPHWSDWPVLNATDRQVCPFYLPGFLWRALPYINSFQQALSLQTDMWNKPLLVCESWRGTCTQAKTAVVCVPIHVFCTAARSALHAVRTRSALFW